MGGTWAIYTFLGIGLLILFVYLVYKQGWIEGFQSVGPAPGPAGAASFNAALFTQQLNTYYPQLNGNSILDINGNRRVTESVLVTGKSYTYPDVDLIRAYIYTNIIKGSTQRNITTGELELISPDLALNTVSKFYDDNYIGLLETHLYGPFIPDKDAPGQFTRDSGRGLLAAVANSKQAFNDAGGDAKMLAIYNYTRKTPVWYLDFGRGEYGQKALNFNKQMRDLYSEMALGTSMNFIYDWETKQFYDPTISALNKNGVFQLMNNSMMSIENAKRNTQSETPPWDTLQDIKYKYYVLGYEVLTDTEKNAIDAVDPESGPGKFNITGYYEIPWFERPSNQRRTPALLDTSQFQSQIYYHGELTPEMQNEIIQNYKLCRRTFLGNAAALPNFLFIDFSYHRIYIRKDTTPYYLKDPVLPYVDAAGKPKNVIMNVEAFNMGNGDILTDDTLALFPFHARTFLKQYIVARKKMYHQILMSLPSNEDYAEAYTIFTKGYSKEGVPLPDFEKRIANVNNVGRSAPIDSVNIRLYRTGGEYLTALLQKNTNAQTDPSKVTAPVVPTYGVNIGDRYFLDSLAQSFYELTDGSFAMSYIYDVFTIGKTIFDVRFDLRKHNSPTAIQEKIRALKTTYYGILAANVDEVTINSARSDYYSNLGDLQAQQSENMTDPVRGVVGRFFIEAYASDGTRATAEKPAIRYELKAVTLDRRAVSSFRAELNCGFVTESGAAPGIVNYTPDVRFTKNQSDPIDCLGEESLKRIMADYEMAAASDLSGAFAAGKTPGPTWDISGQLVVREVLGSQQLNPYQCAIKWKESIYDTTTNEELKKDIVRRARISYGKNIDDWYANETVFDASGFAWLPTDSNPNKCYFQRDAYIDKYNGGNRMNISAGLSDLSKNQIVITDLSENGIKNKASVCPTQNPFDTFDANTYRLMEDNSGAAALFGANKKRLTTHYITEGIKRGKPVAPSWDIRPRATPLKIDKRILADGTLSDGGGYCPARDCSDPSVIQSLMDKYNRDTSKPGVILRVLKAMTVGENQCDIEAEIDYSLSKNLSTDTEVIERRASAQAPAPSPASREGFQSASASAPAPAPAAGVQKKVMTFITSVDPKTCNYSLDKVDDNSSKIFTIQSNTPTLPRPADYGSFVFESNKATMDPLLQSVQKASSVAFDKIKEALTKYRVESNTTSGELSTLDLEGCPNIKCNDETVMLKFLRYAGDKLPASTYISKILKAVALTDTSGGTVNCEYTVTQEEYGYDQPNLAGPRFLNAPGTTKAYRAEVAQPAEGSCSVVFKSLKGVAPSMTPDWSQVSDIQDVVTLQSYAKFSDVMTNYTNTMPKRFVSFTGKKARGIYRDQAGMGLLVERRALDISRVYVKYYSRDSQGNPVTTGGPKEALLTFKVGSDFKATLQSQRAPTVAERTGGYPVGVPNEQLRELVTFSFDAGYCKKSFDCADIQKSLGIPFKASTKVPGSEEVCEIRLTDDESLAVSDNYMKVIVYTEDNCDLALNTVVPSTTESTVMAPIPTFNDPAILSLVKAEFQKQFATNPRRVFGRFLGGRVDTQGGAIIYMITMAEYDAMTPPNMVGYYDDGKFSSPAYLRVDFRRRFLTNNAPFVYSLKLVKVTSTAGFFPVADQNPTTLEDPIKAMRRFKFLRFTPILSRGLSSTVQLMRLQYFTGTEPTNIIGGKASVSSMDPNTPTPTTNPSFLFSSDPMLILRPEESPVYELPINVSLILTVNGFVQPDGFSFMTGSTGSKDCVQWRVDGSLNGLLWKDLHVQTTSYQYSNFRYWRIPIQSFNPQQPPLTLTQNPNRPRGLLEMGIRPTDFKIVLDAARLVYESLSRARGGVDFKTTEPLTGRSFLRGIASYAFIEQSNQVLIKPTYSSINAAFEINTVLVPDIVIILTYHPKRFSDPVSEVVLDTTRSGINSTPAVLNAAGFIPFPTQPTAMKKTDIFPFGWGGLPSSTANFTDMGAVKFTGPTKTDPVPNLFTIDRYMVSTPLGLVQKPFGLNTYSGMSRDGAALICNGSPECIGFFENADGRSGVFYGMPTPTTRLTNVTEATVNGRTPTGEATVFKYNHFYMKKGVTLFQFARLVDLRSRDPASPTVQIGKIAFYAKGKRFEGVVATARNEPSSVLSPTDKLASNLLDYRTPDRFWSASKANLTGVHFEFASPMTADALVIVTAPQEPAGSDLTGFSLMLSLDGVTWTRAFTKQFVPPTVRRKASPMYMFDTTQPDGVTNDFDMKTFESCGQGCGSEEVLDAITDKFYRGRADGRTNTNALTNPMNIRKVGYNLSNSECIVEFDDSNTNEFKQNQRLGFQFKPTYGSCDTLTNPDFITTNLLPSTSVQMNTLDADDSDRFRFIRLRILTLIGGSGSVELGKIIFFDADSKMVGNDAILRTTSLPPPPQGVANTSAEATDYGDQNSTWSETRSSTTIGGPGTLFIEVDPTKIKFPLMAFTMIAGKEYRRAPATWALEASVDSRFWKILHSTDTHIRPSFGLPTTASFQYPQYPFDRQAPPVRIQNVLTKKLTDFGQTCASPEILDIVSMALAQKAMLFDPVSFKYDATTNKCEYRQKNGSSLTATFSTNFYRQDPRFQSQILALDVPTKNPIGGTSAATPALKGIENCDPKPNCTDPATLTLFQQELTKKLGAGTPPLSAKAAGLDTGLNECVFQLDDAYTGTLLAQKKIASDKIGFQFQKGSSCPTGTPNFLQVDTNLPSTYYNPSLKAQTVQGPYRFVRFRVTKTYQPGAKALVVGGFNFVRMLNGQPTIVPLPTGTVVTNPLGAVATSTLQNTTLLSSSGWVDSNKAAIVFQFKDPFAFDAYAWKTGKATTTDGITTVASFGSGNDPVQWKIEGSANGTFWTVLHEQTIDYASNNSLVSPSGLTSKPCALKRDSLQGPFLISNPKRQYRAAAASCETPPPTTYDLQDLGLTCTSPSVWSRAMAAYTSVVAKIDPKRSLKAPPATATAAQRAAFKYSYDAANNMCSYSFLETVQKTSTVSSLDTEVRYADVQFERLLTKPSTLPSSTKVGIRIPTSAPVKPPTTSIVF